jgi:hypothetical protein
LTSIYKPNFDFYPTQGKLNAALNIYLCTNPDDKAAMQFSKFTQLAALTMCTLYSTASPLSPPGLNTTLVGPNINIGTMTGNGISHSTIVAWASGKDRCKVTIIWIDVHY